MRFDKSDISLGKGKVAGILREEDMAMSRGATIAVVVAVPQTF